MLGAGDNKMNHRLAFNNISLDLLGGMELGEEDNNTSDNTTDDHLNSTLKDDNFVSLEEQTPNIHHENSDNDAITDDDVSIADTIKDQEIDHLLSEVTISSK